VATPGFSGYAEPAAATGLSLAEQTWQPSLQTNTNPGAEQVPSPHGGLFPAGANPNPNPYAYVEPQRAALPERPPVVIEQPLKATWIEAAYDEADGKKRAVDLQILTEGVLVAGEDRRCLREGALYKLNRGGRKQYQFFLYTDALIYAEVNGMTYKYQVNREIPLNSIMIAESAEDEPAGHCFRLMSPQKSFVCEAGAPGAKDDWVAAISAAQEANGGGADNAEGKVMAPIFVKDADAAACMICNRGFGILNRRHHCRRCGKCICNACSYDKMRVPGLETEGRLVRCCIPCGNELKSTRSYGNRKFHR